VDFHHQILKNKSHIKQYLFRSLHYANVEIEMPKESQKHDFEVSLTKGVPITMFLEKIRPTLHTKGWRCTLGKCCAPGRHL